MIFKSLLIYFASFGLSIWFAYLYQHSWQKKGYKEFTKIKKLFWHSLIIAPPVIISTIRYDVGTDFFSYVSIYNNINSLPFETVWQYYGNEPMYLFLNKLAYFLFKNEWGIFFLSSLFIHFFLIRGLDYFKRDISIPIALFVYFMYLFSFGLNGIRQAIAMSITFYAIRFILERKPVTYISLIVFATLFHNTAIVCLILYIFVLGNKRLVSFTKNLIYYLLIIFTPVLLLYLMKFFAKLPIFYGYIHYISNLNLTLKFGFLIGIIPVLVFIFLYKNKILAISKKYEVLIYLSFLVIPFRYIGYYVDWGQRMGSYIHMTYIVLVPLVIKSINNKYEKFLVGSYYITYFLFIYFNDIIIKLHHGVFPFKSIFSV